MEVFSFCLKFFFCLSLSLHLGLPAPIKRFASFSPQIFDDSAHTKQRLAGVCCTRYRHSDKDYAELQLKRKWLSTLVVNVEDSQQFSKIMTNIDRYHLVIVGDGSCGKTSILTVFRVSEFLGTGLHLLSSLISGTKVTRITRFLNDCLKHFE